MQKVKRSIKTGVLPAGRKDELEKLKLSEVFSAGRTSAETQEKFSLSTQIYTRTKQREGNTLMR